MQLERILELADLLPDDAPYPQPAPRAMLINFFQSTRSAQNQRRAAARTDHRFLWKFIMCFVRLGRHLPILVTERLLSDVYRYEAYREYNEVLDEVLALDQPKMTFLRNVLHACLIIEGLSYEEIAKRTNIRPEVIRAYEELFFNVRDRMDDRAYIGSLVHPDHRTAELNPRYISLTDAGQYLLRMAYHHGVEPMLVLAGMLKDGVESQAVEIRSRLEASMMANAMQLSRMGLLNQSHVPGIMHGRAIITAIKQSGQEEKTGDTVVGLGAISVSNAVMATLHKIQGPDIQSRRLLRENIASEEKDKKAQQVVNK